MLQDPFVTRPRGFSNVEDSEALLLADAALDLVADAFFGALDSLAIAPVADWAVAPRATTC